jgi:hypothetical protein
VANLTVKIIKPGVAGAWQTPTLLNSWTNLGSGFSPAGYRLEADGVTVRLRGLLTGGTITGGTELFALAPGFYSPSYFYDLAAIGSFGAYVLSVMAGPVKIFSVTSNTFISLDGLTFPIT